MNTENSNEDLDDIFKSADLGDKVWLFFSKYSRMLISTMVVMGLILVLALVIIVGRSICKRSMKMAYLDAIQSENKECFAQKYVSNPLGGAVYLELGDEAYGKKEYKKAAQYYHLACIGLGETIFGGRAAIGESVSLIRAGLIQEGEEALRKITKKKYPKHVYGNAMYLLGVNLMSRGERQQASEWLNNVINGDFFQPLKEQSKKLLYQLNV
jgi:tetratricopeptide (TPR) repeat protein